MIELILAFVFFAAAVWLIFDWARHRKRCTEKAEASVLRVEYNKPAQMMKEIKQYYPVYSFVWNGQEYDVSPKEPSRTNHWEQGQSVELYFDPKDPDFFILKKDVSDLCYGIFALVLAICCLILHSM